jgi:diadenosine tetraphosphatase ApaH/serine/threonine PP2A family protein phosphatase
VLSEDNLGYLSSLQQQETVDGMQLCHGALHAPDLYVTTSTAALPSFDIMVQPIALFGHTHFSEWFEQRRPGLLPIHHEAAGGARIQINPDWRYMINPGAVGQPRDGNSQAGFAIVDTGKDEVLLRRVGYDVAATQQEIREAGLPEVMAQRLLVGV